MKFATLSLVSAAAAVALNVTPAFAQQSTSVTVQTPAATDESIAVEAGRLPEGSPVAVGGTLTGAGENTLILDRTDGRVYVALPGTIDDDDLMEGSGATAYGRLETGGERVGVRADAVLVRESADRARLYMRPSRLESVNKFNRPVTRGEARAALAHFESTANRL